MRRISHRFSRLMNVSDVLVLIREDDTVDLPEVDWEQDDMIAFMTGRESAERRLLGFLQDCTLVEILKHFPVTNLVVAWYIFDVIEAAAGTVQLVSPVIAQKTREFVAELRKATTEETGVTTAPTYKGLSDQEIRNRLGYHELRKIEGDSPSRILRYLIEAATDAIAYIPMILDKGSHEKPNQRRREFMGLSLFRLCNHMMAIDIDLETHRRLAGMPDHIDIGGYDIHESVRRKVGDEGIVESLESRRLWLLRMLFDRLEKSQPELLESHP